MLQYELRAIVPHQLLLVLKYRFIAYGYKLEEIVKATAMSYGQDAIGHLANGKTVFIEGAVLGDTAKIHIVKEKKNFANAQVVSITEPSPFRAKEIPAFAIESGAGWAHLQYDKQLECKRANVVEALKRLAHLSADEAQSITKDVVASKDEWGYRNKIELDAFVQNGRFTLGAHDAITKDETPIAQAPLANRLIEKAPKALTGALRYLQDENELGIYRVGVRGSLRTKSVQVAIWTSPSSFPRGFAAKTLQDAIGATSIVRVIAEKGSARRVKRVEHLAGTPFWEEVISDRSHSENDFHFDISAPSFFQVNTKQADKMVERVLEIASSVDQTLNIDVADIYSGAGTFSIPLAIGGANVTSIELAGSSTRDLRHNCEINNTFVDVICDDAARGIKQIDSADFVIVDPPRSGLETTVIDRICELEPKKVAYISCDPQTLARDIAKFQESGYKLVDVMPVDMFPQTYHIECIAELVHA